MFAFFIRTFLCTIMLSFATSAQQSQPTDEEQEAAEALKNFFSSMDQPDGALIASVEGFFILFNAGEFDKIYDILIDDQVKAAKAKSKFVQQLQSFKKESGVYTSGSQTGLGSGVQMLLTDDQGNELENTIQFKTRKLIWQAEFEKTAASLEFIFVDQEDAGRLYRIDVKSPNGRSFF